MREEGELPEGWTPYTLESLLEPGGLFDGPFGSNLKTSDYTESGVRVVRLENLSNLCFIEEKRTYVSREKYQSLKKHTVRSGDLLFGSFLDDAVRVAMLPELPVPAIAKADCFCIRARRDLVDPRFLMYRLGATETRDALIEEIHGATRPRVTTRQLRRLQIGLPPTAEQVRIAAAVEAALSSVTAASERLSGTGSVLKRLRQSMLAAAVSGELTADWRPVGGLSGWRYLALGVLVKEPMANGRSVPDAERGFPVLRLTAVKTARVDLSQRKIGAWSSSEAARFLVAKGDFLVSRGNGSLSLVGKGALVVDVPDAVAYPDTLIRIRTRVEDLTPSYLAHAWASDAVRGQIEDAAHTTAGIHKVSQQDLAEIIVPVPPLDEQVEIVRRVEALFALAEAIEKRVAAAAARADKLTQAILSKAFRGELVPTEAELNRRREASTATPPPAVRSTAARPAPRRSR